MTIPADEEARVLHYEDACKGLDKIAEDLARIVRRIDAFLPLLREEWQVKLLRINAVRLLDENVIAAMQRLADDIYEQGRHETTHTEKQDI